MAVSPTAARAQPEPQRYENLDGLRGLAALNVAIGHYVSAFYYALYTGAERDSHGAWDIAASGWPFLLPVSGTSFSVCIFLALSGFVLARAVSRSDLGLPAQMVKRIVRLGIPITGSILFAWLLTVVGLNFAAQAQLSAHSDWLGGVVLETDLGEAFLQAVSTSFGLMWRPSTLNAPLWTMAIELFGSLLLFIGLSVKGYRWTSGVALLGIGAALSHHYVALICLGAGIYLLELDRLARYFIRFQVIWALLLVLALFFGTIPGSDQRPDYWNAIINKPPILAPIGDFGTYSPLQTLNVLVAWQAVAAILLLFVALGWPAFRSWLSRPWIVWLGRISFPLYVLHFPLLFSIGCGGVVALEAAGIGYEAAVLLAFPVYLTAVLVASWLGIGLLEEPALALSAKAGRAVQGAVQSLREIYDRIQQPMLRPVDSP